MGEIRKRQKDILKLVTGGLLNMQRRFGIMHIAFLAVVGITGWAAVLMVTLWPPIILRPWHVNYEILAFSILVTISRFLAFRVFRRIRIALDSVFYIAAAFAFGVVPAAWMALLVLTIDAIVRIVRDTSDTEREESPIYYFVANAFYTGGLPSLMVLSIGILLDVDGLYPRDDMTLAWLVPTYSVLFLIAHYLFAGGSHWFVGTPPQDLWRRFLIRVVPSELILTPIALAMVYGYVHQGFIPVLLLGASSLLFNWIFRRARQTRDELHGRVSELSTLNKVGNIISGSLERRILLVNIATATLRLVRYNSRFMIGMWDKELDHVDYELFDESGNLYGQIMAPADEGLSGWVMAHREPLLLNNVQKEYARYAKSDKYNDPRFRSWLGAPLVIYDEVVGVMSVQTEKRNAYSPSHLRVLYNIADQAAVALENSRLYELATVDGLTRLLVRRHFDLRLREEWERAIRYKYPFSIGILDLDNFKNINDSYGHQSGDQVLRAAAGILRNNMRTADLAGRYGGEEFAFILPKTKTKEALFVAERIRTDVENMIVMAQDLPLKTQASIGVAGYPESEVDTVEQLLARADTALYQAKRSGKNQVIVAENLGVSNPNTTISDKHSHLS